MDDICGHCGIVGDLHGVFVVAAGVAGCAVADATDTAGATDGLTAKNAGKASGVAGATTGVVGMSRLTTSG